MLSITLMTPSYLLNRRSSKGLIAGFLLQGAIYASQGARRRKGLHDNNDRLKRRLPLSAIHVIL